MPFVERPLGFDTQIGQGVEKKVYVRSKKIGDRADNLVVKEVKTDSIFFSEYETRPNFVKARYYLTKLLHGLLPDNIPDIHYASVEKDYPSGKKEKPIEIVDRKIEIPEKYLDNFRHRILSDEIFKLVRKLDLFGLDFDSARLNFNFDKNGKIVYFDTFRPWAMVNGVLCLSINLEAIRAEIEKLDDEGLKKNCNNFLDRILELMKNEEKYVNSQRSN